MKKKNVDQVRDVNRSGKLNKRFLDRTLTSIITHNKRANDRIQKNCQLKLKELDKKRKKDGLKIKCESDPKNHRSRLKTFNHKIKKRNQEKNKINRKSKRKKKKRKLNGYDSDCDDIDRNANVNFKYCEDDNFKRDRQSFDNLCYDGSYFGSNVLTNIAAITTYNKMMHLTEYSKYSANEEFVYKKEVKNKLKLENDMSLRLSDSLSVSSFEENNDCIYTINVSSDENTNEYKKRKLKSRSKVANNRTKNKNLDLSNSTSSEEMSPQSTKCILIESDSEINSNFSNISFKLVCGKAINQQNLLKPPIEPNITIDLTAD